MHLLRNCQYFQSWPIIYVDEADRSEREQRNRRLQQRRRGSIRILFSASEVVPNRGRMANLDQAIHGGLGGRALPRSRLLWGCGTSSTTWINGHLAETTASWGWSRQVQRGTIHHINPISDSRM